jgi:hypothetical protein
MHPVYSRLLRIFLIATLGLVFVMAGNRFTPTLAVGGVTLPGSTFESGDGNLQVDTTGDEDWNTSGVTCAAGPPPIPQTSTCGIDLASGTGDDAFGQGAKEDNACNTVVSGSIPPNKSDLTRFYIKREKQSGQSFLYLAWERTNSLGNANMDFEFNQAETLCANGVTPVKTAGDALITYDFGGSGPPDVGLLRWLTAAAGNTASQCFASSSLPCWGNRIDLSQGGLANAGINDPVDISTCNPKAKPTTGCEVFDGILGGTLPIDTFGEAGINLTSSGLFPPGQCVSFGSTHLSSRSSSSFTAEVKDFIPPIQSRISNCGNVTIIKHTHPRGVDKTFTYTSDIAGTQLSCSQPVPRHDDGGQLHAQRQWEHKCGQRGQHRELHQRADWQLHRNRGGPFGRLQARKPNLYGNREW